MKKYWWLFVPVGVLALLGIAKAQPSPKPPEPPSPPSIPDSQLCEIIKPAINRITWIQYPEQPIKFNVGTTPGDTIVRKDQIANKLVIRDVPVNISVVNAILLLRNTRTLSEKIMPSSMAKCGSIYILYFEGQPSVLSGEEPRSDILYDIVYSADYIRLT